MDRVKEEGFGFVWFLKILHFLCLRQVWAGVGAGKPIKGQQIQQALLEMGVCF